MPVSIIGRLPLFLAVIIAAYALVPSAIAEPFSQGLKTCQDCHRDEYKTWESTKHFTSYRTVHKAREAKKIAVAIGGKKNMKRNKYCVSCHYATQQKSAGDKPKIKTGPSCESCHGASSDWEAIHFDYGGKNIKREAESGEHKAKRIANSTHAGLIWAAMTYDLAVNCMKCHGLARPGISGEIFSKMLDAGHPINQSFEITLFSQGKMRHWLDKRSPAQLAKLYVAGQAAKLVSATDSAASSSDGKYKASQLKRVSDAKAALQAFPQAATFIASPSDASARDMMEVIGTQDLSSLVGESMPCAGPDRENLLQC
ncbi:MAG: hypothetical protein HOB79_10120 [Rhodospirillaceae bacterium]|jgi:hypothetical protein|nr:hypothetical protein [Rhodospirillaceae bacterium]MBT5240348.1 hypothetical protein [Rhodospirillaceae bacterium]MBT7768901.1 hypothetical protein [Rhodospirillales bacterium]MBT8003322.1 hypothetical protein [Rhodospirillales bacterium]